MDCEPILTLLATLVKYLNGKIALELNEIIKIEILLSIGKDQSTISNLYIDSIQHFKGPQAINCPIIFSWGGEETNKQANETKHKTKCKPIWNCTLICCTNEKNVLKKIHYRFALLNLTKRRLRHSKRYILFLVIRVMLTKWYWSCWSVIFKYLNGSIRT